MANRYEFFDQQLCCVVFATPPCFLLFAPPKGHINARPFVKLRPFVRPAHGVRTLGGGRQGWGVNTAEALAETQYMHTQTALTAGAVVEVGALCLCCTLVPTNREPWHPLTTMPMTSVARNVKQRVQQLLNVKCVTEQLEAHCRA